MKNISKTSVIIVSFMFSIILIETCTASEVSDTYTVQKVKNLANLKQHLQRHVNSLQELKSSFNQYEMSLSSDILSTIEQNIENIIEYEGYVDKIIPCMNYEFKNNSSEIFEVLDAFMSIRLGNLYVREKNIQKVMENENIGERITYSRTTDPKRQDELTDFEHILCNLTTDLYQTLNRAIIGILSLIDKTKLPASSQKLLKMSPALWPLITNPTSDDFGHPDEAIFSDDPKDCRDIHYFKYHELNIKLQKENGKVVPYELPTLSFLLPTSIEKPVITNDD